MHNDAASIRLAIVVPTRNRAHMAIRSVESVMTCGVDSGQVGVVVSDNSTDPGESEVLERYKKSLAGAVTIVRPQASLPMTAHWNFALGQAMRIKDYTHFMFLTDRMLVRAKRIRQVIDMLTLFPDEVLSFAYDRIDDVRRPVVYRPLPRSGGVFRISSSTLLGMSSRMIFPSCLPRMLNSVAPRSHFDAMQTKFGSAFASLSPDFSFCYRTLGMRDSILFYDRSALVTYGLDRSNGNSFARGVMTSDRKDFVSNTSSGKIDLSSPYPEFMTVGNAVIHEYLVAKHEPNQKKFPEIGIDDYRRMLANEVRKYVDKQQVEMSLARLRQLGWSEGFSSVIKRWRLVATETVLGIFSKRFDGVEKAIMYAGTHEGPAWRWLPHPIKAFGEEVSMERVVSRAG